MGLEGYQRRHAATVDPGTDGIDTFQKLERVIRCFSVTVDSKDGQHVKDGQFGGGSQTHRDGVWKKLIRWGLARFPSPRRVPSSGSVNPQASLGQIQSQITPNGIQPRSGG